LSIFRAQVPLLVLAAISGALDPHRALGHRWSRVASGPHQLVDGRAGRQTNIDTVDAVLVRNPRRLHPFATPRPLSQLLPLPQQPIDRLLPILLALLLRLLSSAPVFHEFPFDHLIGQFVRLLRYRRRRRRLGRRRLCPLLQTLVLQKGSLFSSKPNEYIIH
jgi:hypothetical protein